MRLPSFQPRAVSGTAQTRVGDCTLFLPDTSADRQRTRFFWGAGSVSAAGAVLLEVVLALTLFVAAAAVLGMALSSAIDGVERQRLNTHAANLAVTVLSEIQLGIRTSGEGGAVPFAAPFKSWTVEVLQTPVENELGESSSAVLVEVVVRHADPPVTHRLAQIIQPRKNPTFETPLAVR